MIKVSKLSKTFFGKHGAVSALKGVSFEVQPGQVFALLGPNGSGKTTTLNILSKLLEPDSGSFEVLGRIPNDPGYFDGISFMSGDSELYWAFAVKLSLNFYAELHGVDWSIVERLLKDFGADGLIARPWMALSNGEKTKIRLVQCLMTSPKVLFLDEPTVGLDPDIADTVRTKLKELNAKGLTLFLTSHYMKDVDSLASQVAFIKSGSIIEIADRASFGSLDDIEQRFIRLAREGR
jgi:ABC-2 type transport system ATP-binding protein